MRSSVADRRGHLVRAAQFAFEAWRRAPADGAITARLYGLAVRRGERSFLERVAAGFEAQAAARGGARTAWFAHVLWRRLDNAPRARAMLERAMDLGWTEAEARKPPRGASLPAPVQKFVAAFRRGVIARYRHYRSTREADSVDEFVDWARDLYERETGATLAPRGVIHRFRFVGALVDAREESDEPLVRELAAHGVLLVLGQRKGGPPEAILARVERREPGGRTRVRGVEIEREAVWIRSPIVSGYAEWGGGGDIAGLALAGLVLIDVDAVASWEGRLRRRRARLAPIREELLAEPALDDKPVRAVDDPAGVADRLNLSGELRLAEEILVHEDAHLVDAALHLPVGKYPWRNLKLALSRGLSPTRILAYLERNAQLTAIAEGPAPRAALTGCCERLGGNGPHARGYTEIVQGMVDAILRTPARFPAIDCDRVVVQQLHRLTDKQIRSLAVELMRDWELFRKDR